MGEKMKTKIKTLQDVADIINMDTDKGLKEIKQIYSKMDRSELEAWAFKMAMLVSMVPEFLEE